MIPVVGSLVDIVAIVELSYKIFKSLSAKAGSERRYKELLHEIETDYALLLMALRFLADETSDVKSVPGLEGMIRHTVWMYASLWFEIADELQRYEVLRQGASIRRERSPDSRVAAAENGPASGDDDPGVVIARDHSSRSSQSMKVTWKKITFAFFGEKSLKEKIESLAPHRRNLQFLVQLTQMGIQIASQKFMVAQSKIFRAPARNVTLHDLSGQCFSLPLELIRSKEILHSTLSLLFERQPAIVRNLIDRGDYEISSELGDDSGTEMALKEKWPQDVEPGSNINMTALLHRVHPGDGSAPGNHTCPACLRVNTEGKANVGKSMINCPCGKRFSILERFEDEVHISDSAQNGLRVPSKSVGEHTSDTLYSNSDGHIRDEASNGDIFRFLQRFQLIFTKYRPAHLDRDRFSTSSMSSLITLHPSLAGTNLGFDVTHGIQPQVNPPLSTLCLREPATDPPVSQLILRCETFSPAYSWTIHPSHHPSSSDDEPPDDTHDGTITVNAVLRAIRSFLHEPLLGTHLDTLTIDQARKVTDTFNGRCSAGGMGLDEELKERGPTVHDWIATMKLTFVNGLAMSIDGGDSAGNRAQLVTGFSFQRSGHSVNQWRSEFFF